MKFYLLSSWLLIIALAGCSEPSKSSAVQPAVEPAKNEEALRTSQPSVVEDVQKEKRAAEMVGGRAITTDKTKKTVEVAAVPTDAVPVEKSRPATEGDKEKTYSKVLLDPALATLKAPDKYTVRLKTTRGDVLIDVTKEWAPHAADRFFNLVKAGYFTEVAFYRVIAGFMAQAGIHGDPKISKLWGRLGIPDEQPKQSNTRGMVSFAAAGRNSRSNQFFINFGNNANLDNYPPSGFPPFGKVRNMAATDRIFSGYGEGAPMGRGPRQSRANNEGNAYFKAEFPQLDYIREAHVEG